MTKLLRPAHHPEEIEKEKFASLKELDVEKKHWLKEIVKLDESNGGGPEIVGPENPSQERGPI